MAVVGDVDGTCSYCLRPLKRPAWRFRRVQHPTCSRDCRDAWARERQERKARVYLGNVPYVPVPKDHPLATAKGYAREHCVVAMKYLGRPLRPGEKIVPRSRDPERWPAMLDMVIGDEVVPLLEFASR